MYNYSIARITCYDLTIYLCWVLKLAWYIPVQRVVHWGLILVFKFLSSPLLFPPLLLKEIFL